MSKWADKLIDAVKFNSQHSHIDYIQCRDDLGESVSNNKETLSRQEVITKIKKGVNFCTIFRGEDGKWKYGAAVTIITIDGEEFIKTKADRLKKDNLDNLPEFSRSSSLGL